MITDYIHNIFNNPTIEYSEKETGCDRNNYIPVVMFLSSFIMYILAILPIIIARGLPFFYYGDYNVQQVPFYILAHRAVRSGNLFWNWNLDLGGSMAGDFSFYLWGSPFFWISTLFPERMIPYLMPLLMAAKYATAATCAYLYIRRYVGKYTYAMIGGYLYAFSGFNACNIVFNHFTEAVAFFPLFLLTFENLMEADFGHENGKFKPAGRAAAHFALMTAFMAIINYYFFFGQALFLIIYFFVRYFEVKDKGFVTGLIRFGRALLFGTLGVLLAGFFVVPAFMGLQGNTRLDNYINGYNMLVYPSGKLIWDILKSLVMLPDIIGKGTLFYTGTVKNASLAAYIPMFGIAGVVAFFLMNRKKNWEKRLLLVCLVMAVIPVLNAAFSMFNSSYYARWFYMPVLVMCLMTAQAAERGKSTQLKKGTVATVLLFFFFVGVYFLPTVDEEGKTVFFNMAENNAIFLRDVLGTAVVLLLLLIAVFAIPKTKPINSRNDSGSRRNNITVRDVIVLFLVIISCVIATFVPVKNGSSIISQRGKDKWTEQMLGNKVVIDQSQFCRGEVDGTSTNYDMVWGIPSLHCFLSTVPSQIFNFLEGSAGITRTVETNIPIERCGLRTLLSGKYYFENADISKNRVFADGQGTDGYAYLDSQNGFDVFQNLNYIPMGFTFDHYITESEWETLEAGDHDYDLLRVVILPDEYVEQHRGELKETELTASEIENNPLSYFMFTNECEARYETACTSFVADTKGFSAKTADLSRDSLVFFSVPNAKGFSAQVDGVDTEIVTADYGLMAIPVNAGVHDIVVSYRQEGLTAGIIISICGLLVLIGYIVAIKKINSK